jgi:hypothetical protein
VQLDKAADTEAYSAKKGCRFHQGYGFRLHNAMHYQIALTKVI